MRHSVSAAGAAVLAAVGLVGGGPARAQDQTIQIMVDDTSFQYGTPGYTFVVVPITVTDAANFMIDSISQGATAGQVGIMDFIVFLPGVTIPTGPGTSYGTHASDPDAVGSFFDGAPDGINPSRLSPGPAAPVAEGDYQLVVAPYDHSGTAGDFFVTLQLYGVTTRGHVRPGLTSAQELAALVAASGGTARLMIVDASGIARDMGRVSLAARAAGPDATRVAPAAGGLEVSASSRSAPGRAGALHTWAEITGFGAEDGNGSGHVRGAGLQIGADVEITPGVVAGVALGYSDIEASDTGFRQTGDMVYLQPYLAYRAGPWSGTASLLYGRGRFDQLSSGGAGSGRTDLMAVTFEGGRDVALGEGLTLTPMLGLIHGRETVEGIGGTLAGSGARDYRFTQGSVGLRLTRDWAGGSAFAGLHADYLAHDTGSFLTDTFLSEDGWTGRLELGTSMDLANGSGLTLSLELSGLGGRAETLTGGLRVALTF